VTNSMQKRFFRQTLCLIGCLVSLAIGNAQSQGDTIQVQLLQEVVVTEKTRPATMRQTAPLQIMDREGIERLGIRELTEAIRHFSGVTVKDYGGIGGLKTISIRNLGTQYTGIIYDGVAVNDCQSGQVDLGRFSLDNVGRLSLSIGQTDRIFQTARMFASAGTLEIQTATPVFTEKSFHTSLKIKGGSFRLFAPSIRYEQRITNHLSASLQTDWLSAQSNYPFILTNGQTITHEQRKNSDIQSIRLEGNVYGEWENNRHLTAKFYHYNSERGLPGSVILYNDYARERLWDKNTFIQALYRNESDDHFHWQALAKFNHTCIKYVNVNNLYESGQQEDCHLQREYYASASAGYFPAAQWSFSLNTDFFVNTLHSSIPECPFPKRYTTLAVLAAQHKSARLTVAGSLLGMYMSEHLKIEEKTDDRKRLSPAISASWLLFPEKNLRVRASYKDVYRTPTFNDLYYLRVGNRHLHPEKATQYNLGITWSGEIYNLLRYINISIDGYHNRVHDKIVAIPTLYVWKMMNLGEVSIYGLDINLHAEVALSKQINLFFQGAYSRQKAVDITNENSKTYRHQIPYTPGHSGSISSTIVHSLVNVSYSLTGVDKRYALPENILSNEIKGYIEQSITVGRTIHLYAMQLRIQAEIINVGNVQYDVIKYYPMPGRSYRISIECKL